LKWAHTHGGANWPKTKKRAFSNDRANLIAVEDNVNQGQRRQRPLGLDAASAGLPLRVSATLQCCCGSTSVAAHHSGTADHRSDDCCLSEKN